MRGQLSFCELATVCAKEHLHLTPIPRQSDNLLSLYISWHFLEFHINGILLYVLFSVCLLAFSIITWRFTHVVSIICSFYFRVVYAIVWIYPNLLVQSPADGQIFGLFPVWAYYKEICREYLCIKYKEYVTLRKKALGASLHVISPL